MVPLALERLQTRNAGCARGREIARRHDAERGGDDLARVGLERPGVGLAVEDGGADARVELDIAPEIEAIRNMVDVAEDLRLRAVALGPLPFLLQLVGEGVGILHAFHVAAAAGIAVPEPGAADAACGLIGSDLQAEAAQAIDGIEAPYARAHDDDIEFGGVGLVSRHPVYLRALLHGLRARTAKQLRLTRAREGAMARDAAPQCAGSWPSSRGPP